MNARRRRYGQHGKRQNGQNTADSNSKQKPSTSSVDGVGRVELGILKEGFIDQFG